MAEGVGLYARAADRGGVAPPPGSIERQGGSRLVPRLKKLSTKPSDPSDLCGLVDMRSVRRFGLDGPYQQAWW